MTNDASEGELLLKGYFNAMLPDIRRVAAVIKAMSYLRIHERQIMNMYNRYEKRLKEIESD